jgi:hypothetical protein
MMRARTLVSAILCARIENPKVTIQNTATMTFGADPAHDCLRNALEENIQRLDGVNSDFREYVCLSGGCEKK